MLKTHVDAGADVTIAAKPVHSRDASALGVMRVSDSGRVTGFVEKPKTDDQLAEVRMDPGWIDRQGIESGGRDCLASMGIYLFNRQVLTESLEASDHVDFGKEIFPSLIGQSRSAVAPLRRILGGHRDNRFVLRIESATLPEECRRLISPTAMHRSIPGRAICRQPASTAPRSSRA